MNITDIVNIGCAFSKVDNEPDSTIKICNEITAEKVFSVVKDII